MSDLRLELVAVDRGPRRVLDSVYAHFRAGRLSAVIGPNGAGKSTLMRVAAGLLRPDRGRVLLGETPVARLGRQALARRRAYLPQSPRIDWPIAVEQVVALGLTPDLPAFGRRPDVLRERIEAALRDHDLEDLRGRPATMVSGGELARVMLARATVGDPEVLIVDEPTAGLDPRHGLDAVRRLRRRADLGRTVVMAIHDLDLALRVADDVIALKAGRVIAAGDAEAVFTEEVLSELYDLRVRVVRDPDGTTLRFLG